MCVRVSVRACVRACVCVCCAVLLFFHFSCHWGSERIASHFCSFIIRFLSSSARGTWASSLCYELYFGDVWVNQGVGDEKAFLKEFKERVLSMYRQEWDNSIRTKERFTVYSTFKSSLSLAPYLNELKHVKARNFLIRLRLGVSPLRTHKLRYRERCYTCWLF